MHASRGDRSTGFGGRYAGMRPEDTLSHCTSCVGELSSGSSFTFGAALAFDADVALDFAWAFVDLPPGKSAINLSSSLSPASNALW